MTAHLEKPTPQGRVFAKDQRRAAALPLGGLGAGHVALCGDGALRQWQLHNIPNHRGHIPGSFFALRLMGVDPPSSIGRILQSAAVPGLENPAPNVSDHETPGDSLASERWPFVDDTLFEVAYPYARIRYVDDALPVEVALEAVTPFVPLDADASGLPLVRYRFTLRNRSHEFVHGWLASSLQNSAGWDGVTPIRGNRCGHYGGNVNRLIQRADRTAVLMDNPRLAETAAGAGQLLLSTSHPAAALPRFAAADDLLRYMSTLQAVYPERDMDPREIRRLIRERAVAMSAPVGPSAPGETWNAAVVAAVGLEPGASVDVEFIHAWYFPNRYVDFDHNGNGTSYRRSSFFLGNAYAARFGDVAEVHEYFESNRALLLGQSQAWADACSNTSGPDVIADIASAQGSLVRSPTVFRSEDGTLFGFEGSLGESTLNWNSDAGGSCPLNCTHVWNYEQALSRMFPQLERTMRDTEFRIQGADGSIPHRVVVPLYLPQLHGVVIGGPANAALDGMLGVFLKSYREVRQGAGIEWLTTSWPRLVLLLEHISRTWDTEGDGILRGEQPVTYDIALTGPNMFIGSLWLAALRAMQEMAQLVEPGMAARLGDRFTAASAAYDQLLWNGEYYAQTDAGDRFDFGDGCLSDQLLGQWWAHQLELGHLLPVERVRSALAAIVRHNFRAGFTDFGVANRIFADGDDRGLVICSWPNAGRPAVPVRYCDEVWTGIEYQVAAHCLMEGMADEGLLLLQSLRDRHDGTRRNPYNEVECGDHYARAMAGWSVVEASTGFRYDAVARRMSLHRTPQTFPFLAGSGWGTVELAGSSLTVRCLGGVVDVDTVVVGDDPIPFGERLTAGDARRLKVQHD